MIDAPLYGGVNARLQPLRAPSSPSPPLRLYSTTIWAWRASNTGIHHYMGQIQHLAPLCLSQQCYGTTFFRHYQAQLSLRRLPIINISYLHPRDGHFAWDGPVGSLNTGSSHVAKLSVEDSESHSV